MISNTADMPTNQQIIFFCFFFSSTSRVVDHSDLQFHSVDYVFNNIMFPIRPTFYYYCIRKPHYLQFISADGVEVTGPKLLTLPETSGLY